jgi:hypothetical protein
MELQNVQECDATAVDKGTKVGHIKKQLDNEWTEKK